jgi:hypothetical protein
MYIGYRACFHCHSWEAGASLTSPDIYALMTANEDNDAHHDVLARDQAKTGAGRLACQNCHNSHAATEATPLIDPYDPAPWNQYRSVSATFSSTTNHWENSFCFECHDNTLPTAADTEPWVPAPFWSDPSGDGTTTSDFDDITARWTSQNHGTRSTSNENVWSDIPTIYGANPELLCVDCHEPHGTLGVRNLRSDIAHNNAVMVIDLPTGYDPRFWCTGCHQWPLANHNMGSRRSTVFPKDCTNSGACHGHQDGGGKF